MHHLHSNRLTEAADGLLASLQKAQAELEQISNKLEEEFSKTYKGGQVNPLSILTRLNKLRRWVRGCSLWVVPWGCWS